MCTGKAGQSSQQARRRTARKNVRRKQQANQGKMRREENLFLVVLARGVLLWGIPFHSAGHKEKWEQGTAGGGRENGRERGLTYNCLFHLFSSGLFLVKTFQHMGGRERESASKRAHFCSTDCADGRVSSQEETV